MIIKVLFNGELRRVSLEDQSLRLEVLHSVLREIFGQSLPASYSLKYKDDEDESVSIFLEREFQDAVELMKQTKSLLRLEIIARDPAVPASDEQRTPNLPRTLSRDPVVNLAEFLPAAMKSMNIEEDQARSEKPKNEGIEHFAFCDSCNSREHIRGVRYKCLDCPDFDLCEECYKNKAHGTEHQFWQIDTPIDADEIGLAMPHWFGSPSRPDHPGRHHHHPGHPHHHGGHHHHHGGPHGPHHPPPPPMLHYPQPPHHATPPSPPPHHLRRGPWPGHHAGGSPPRHHHHAHHHGPQHHPYGPHHRVYVSPGHPRPPFHSGPHYSRPCGGNGGYDRCGMGPVVAEIVAEFDELFGGRTLAETNNNGEQPAVHVGVTCDGCNSGEYIRGARFQCLDEACKNLDLCGDCEQNGFTNETHNPLHLMRRVEARRTMWRDLHPRRHGRHGNPCRRHEPASPSPMTPPSPAAADGAAMAAEAVPVVQSADNLHEQIQSMSVADDDVNNSNNNGDAVDIDRDEMVHVHAGAENGRSELTSSAAQLATSFFDIQSTTEAASPSTAADTTSAVMETSDTSTTATAAAAAVDENGWESKLRQLQDMGFADRQYNLQLLAVHQGDLLEVVRSLLG